MPIYVRGMRELQAAFAKTDRDTRLGVRHLFRDLAEPVRRDAEVNALMQIPRIGNRWYRMRTGVTRNVVYVAPRQRGVKGRPDDPRRRPKFADLLMGRAMEPALEAHETEIEGATEHLLDRICDDFNRGGPTL